MLIILHTEWMWHGYSILFFFYLNGDGTSFFFILHDKAIQFIILNMIREQEFGTNIENNNLS